MRVVCNIDAGEILRRRGLQPDGSTQRLFTVECAWHMGRYIPMQSGLLKNIRFIGPNYVQYNSPYAHYQYRGVLMLAPNGSSRARKGEGKHDSGRELNYHSSPLRGKEWDKRMWNDNKERILRKVAVACGGMVK